MKSVCVLLLLVIAWLRLPAQCIGYDSNPPQLRHVTVTCLTTKDPVSAIVTFRYILRNDRRSTGCIERFQLDIKRADDTQSLTDSGLVNVSRHVDRTALSDPHAAKVVPVGIPVLPTVKGATNAWWAGFSIAGEVDWIRGFPKYLLEPGMELDSLILITYGLPGPRAFIVTPKYDPVPDTTKQETTEEEEHAFAQLLDLIRVKGITIGPTAPPISFVPITWIDTLLSYAQQSTDLGWLGKGRDDDCDDDERPESGIVKNIELRLQKAKRELTKGDSVQGRKELEKLVQKVERIRKRSQEEEKKHKRDRWEKDSNVIMTGEAYALLKYNTEYLIDRLPEKSKNEKDDKDKKPKK